MIASRRLAAGGVEVADDQRDRAFGEADVSEPDRESATVKCSSRLLDPAARRRRRCGTRTRGARAKQIRPRRAGSPTVRSNASASSASRSAIPTSPHHRGEHDGPDASADRARLARSLPRHRSRPTSISQPTETRIVPNQNGPTVVTDLQRQQRFGIQRPSDRVPDRDVLRLARRRPSAPLVIAPNRTVPARSRTHSACARRAGVPIATGVESLARHSRRVFAACGTASRHPSGRR